MPEYAVNKFLLTTAGEMTIHQQAGVFRFIRALDSSGALDLDAEIEVQAGTANDDFVPLAPSQAFFIRARTWKIKWAAQPGVTAHVFLSADKDDADVDARPAKQLITSALATIPTQTAVVVGVAEVSLVVANAARHAVTFQNLGTVDIFIGKTGVLTTTGLKIAAGQAYTTTTCTGEYFAISGTAGQDVRVLEEAS